MVLGLDLDAMALGREMAIALAVTHWKAQVDGMDSEYVLGSAMTTTSDRRRPYTTAPGATTIPAPRKVRLMEFTKRAIHMWVIDFDKASRISLTRNDVDKKLIPAFLGNNPYYPRPVVDQDLGMDLAQPI